MSVSYSYAILRYFHDIATGECVNVGVVVFAPKARYLGLRCAQSAERAARLFPDLQTEGLENALRSLELRFEAQSASIAKEAQSASDRANVLEIARSILPDSDSSLKWGSPGGGLTKDAEQELGKLFERMVSRYEPAPKRMFEVSSWGLANVAMNTAVLFGSNTTLSTGVIGPSLLRRGCSPFAASVFAAGGMGTQSGVAAVGNAGSLTFIQEPSVMQIPAGQVSWGALGANRSVQAASIISYGNNSLVFDRAQALVLTEHMQLTSPTATDQ